MLAEGVLTRVVADPAASRRDLAAARTHVGSAEAVSATDPTAAFSIAYDAARKAVVAHLRARGLRIRVRQGAHFQTGRYARAALDELGIDEHLAAFEDMRRVRNDTEYDAVLVSRSDADEALTHARAIVDAVERDFT